MLTIHDLAFERNQQYLFRGINDVLYPGNLLQVRGANGSGKSTLLRLLAGLLEPHNGTISWKNQPITQQKENYFKQLQYVGHQNALKPYLTVKENLLLQHALFDKKINLATIDTILTTINLKHTAHTQVFHLSAGQLRRLSLAKLLFYPVPLWILDEPATALDAAGEQLLINLLKQHQANGGIAILATHQPLTLDDTKIIWLEAANASN